ncbi:MAG: hypothetical protein AAFN92_21130, partial [Bacteroidota bacterium]
THHSERTISYGKLSAFLLESPDQQKLKFKNNLFLTTKRFMFAFVAKIGGRLQKVNGYVFFQLPPGTAPG